ncbi:MAG TPA: FtsX-like permease family protein, partial [Erysipelotrichaceae bacterium]|nr:FtsX-like permease family protein [Erysipelotrichaceae bacterium]
TSEKVKVYNEIDTNKQDLLNKQTELYTQYDELLKARRSIEYGLSQLNLGINQAETSFNQAQSAIDSALASLNANPGLPTQEEWDASYALLQAQQVQLNNERAYVLEPLYAQRNEVLNQQAQVEYGIQSINEGFILIEDGLVQIDDAYLKANKEFAKAQKLLNDGIKEYEEGLIEFNNEKNDAYLKLDESVFNYYEILVKGEDKVELENVIKTDDRYIYWIDRDAYPGNAMLENILSPIKVMTTIFPLLFFMVAAILILITMAKMVEHDRTQVAIMKALGLSTRTITLSYLMYGWLAALSGSLIFGYFGNWLIPTVLFNIFTTRFSIPLIQIVYYHGLSFVAILLSLFFSSVAILLALRSVLKETPAQGLRPKPPKNARRSMLEKVKWFWNKLSYANKLMIRNLSVGRMKILLSSIGVVGAIALLVIGLSLRSSANTTIQNTINTYNFDASIQLSEEVPYDQLPELPVSIEKIEPTISVNADFNNQIIQLNALSNHQELLSITNLNGKLVDINQNSFIIPQSFAILNQLKVGDEFTFSYDENEYTFKITDISNQYLGKTMYISMDRLNQLGVEKNTKRFYLKTTHEFNDSLKDALLKNQQIESIDTKSIIIERSNEMLSMLNQVILIILISSFALTSTVIYNLASINIVEREREIATLRVLGYTHREVKRLINSENYVLLTLGSILGLPVGSFLSRWISHMVSTNEFYMPDVIEPNVLLFSVFIAFIITFITNLILEIKIRRIQLVESLKAVE